MSKLTTLTNTTNVAITLPTGHVVPKKGTLDVDASTLGGINAAYIRTQTRHKALTVAPKAKPAAPTPAAPSK